MNIETIQSVYFVGAGGIGMSANVEVPLTRRMTEGIERPLSLPLLTAT